MWLDHRKYHGELVSKKPAYIPVCWKDIVLKEAVVVAADFHNAIKHFGKPDKISNHPHRTQRLLVVNTQSAHCSVHNKSINQEST